MKKNLKITIIGAGSSYTPELIEGLIKRNHVIEIKKGRFLASSQKH